MADPQLSGLVRILSSEPMPEVPPISSSNAELDRYFRSWHQYIRRLTGKFTATNILQTIINSEGGAAFSKRWNFDYKGTEATVSFVLDDTIDWRAAGPLVFSAGLSDSISDLRIDAAYGATSTWDQDLVNPIAGDTVDADITNISVGGVGALRVWMSGTDGSLNVEITNASTPASGRFYLTFSVLYGPTIPTSGFVQKGNRS